MGSSGDRDNKTICLFDVDDTLTKPRGRISAEMDKLLTSLSKKVLIGLVSGSDLAKTDEQMGGSVVRRFDYVFSQNGLLCFRNGERFFEESIQHHLGEEKLQTFINHALRYMSNLNLPFKRGTFIECRTGMINVCPCGRSCTQAEREAFAEYDAKHHVREKFVAELQELCKDMGLKFSIGGQISFDVFPIGWDKSYCLRHLVEDGVKTIHFFGDKTSPGGNDHEICNDPRVIGHTVTDPEHTAKLLKDLFLGN